MLTRWYSFAFALVWMGCGSNTHDIAHGIAQDIIPSSGYTLKNVDDGSHLLRLSPHLSHPDSYYFETCLAGRSVCMPAVLDSNNQRIHFSLDQVKQLFQSQIKSLEDLTHTQNIAKATMGTGAGIGGLVGGRQLYDHAYEFLPNTQDFSVTERAFLARLSNEGFDTIESARLALTSYAEYLDGHGLTLSENLMNPTALKKTLIRNSHVFTDEFFYFVASTLSKESLPRSRYILNSTHLFSTAKDFLNLKPSDVSVDQIIEAYAHENFGRAIGPEDILSPRLVNDYQRFQALKKDAAKWNIKQLNLTVHLSPSQHEQMLMDIGEFVSGQGYPQGFRENFSYAHTMNMKLHQYFPHPNQGRIVTSPVLRADMPVVKLMKSPTTWFLAIMVAGALASKIAIEVADSIGRSLEAPLIFTRYPSLTAPYTEGNSPTKIPSVKRTLYHLARALEELGADVHRYCLADQCYEIS